MTKRLAAIAGEAVLLAGGARAILLQIANPSIGRAVARHSDFAAHPLLRLRTTLTYIYVVAYGTGDEVARIARLVNGSHARVSGASYDAADSELQLWVAATLYDTALTLYEKILGPLDAGDAEAVYRDYAVLGSTLQVPRELWPHDRREFRQYCDDASQHLRVGPETKAVARDLLHPRAAPLWLRSIMPLTRLVTTGLLTAEQRAAYNLPWNAGRQRRFDRAIQITALLYPRLPQRVRQWPKDRYLRRFRASAEIAREVTAAFWGSSLCFRRAFSKSDVVC